MRARLLALLLVAPLALAGCDGAAALLAPLDDGTTIGTSAMLRITRTSADPSKTTVAPGETLTLTVDSNRATATYDWTASGGALTPAGREARWTAPAASGLYYVNVSARDGSETAPASFKFTVKVGG